MIQSRRSSRQRGASLFGMLILAVIVGFLMLMGARVFPSVNEYLTIRKALSSIMRAGPASADAIRTSFERTTEVEYSIHTITSKDLKITPVGDSGFRTSFAYDVEIPIFDPMVFLLMKYSGSYSSGGATGP
jgi:hypothetical protein